MMASHRPAENPPPPPLEPTPAPAVPGGKSSLPESGFLAGFDWLLAFGVLVLAFLTASFAARNSDFWMHLATGRLLAAGEYQFGKDPFSYVGADRVWVNHAWLFDWLLYQLYKSAQGPGLIVAKAILVALTAAFLLLARKPGQSMFPGVVCVGLAILAAAPRLLLQSTLVSFLGLAILMFLIIRVPRRPGSWKFPVLVAALFGIWANCDQWFILGPAVLLLYTLGQYLRLDEGEDTGTLWKAIGLGVVACMLNPHHVRVWALPSEAFDSRLAETFAGDVEMTLLFRGGLDKEAWDFEANPANPISLILILILTIAGFIWNRKQASMGLGLVVIGMAALAAVHVRAIPFFALATAPVAALNLAALGRRVAAIPMAEGTARALGTVQATGRGAIAIIGLLLIALTYPGWVHPLNQQRRWSWDVEPSQSLVRVAERIQKWRTDGTLPAEARLLNLGPDIAHYIAWYAPGEKTFFDLRLRFHRPESAEFSALRRYLAIRDPRERKQDSYDLVGFLRKHNITYAVSAHPLRSLNQAAVNTLWTEESDPRTGPDWALWHVDGRAVVLGWTKQETIPTTAFDRLRFDPLRAAYVEAEPLPTPPVRPPLPPRDVWERFVVPPPMIPPEAEEAFVLMRYRESLMFRVVSRHQATLAALHFIAIDRMMTPALSYWTFLPLDPRAQGLVPPIMPPEVSAVALLAVRAARRAIATSPDHPDGYYFLAKAYQDSAYYMFQDVQEIVITTSLGRCRARLPDDPSQRRPTIDVLDLCDQLDQAHNQAIPRRLDLRFDVTRLSVIYLADDIAYLEGEMGRFSGELRTQMEKELDGKRKDLAAREKMVKEAEADLRRSTDKYINAAASLSAALDRAALARQFGLIKEAISELFKAHEQFQKQLGDGSKFSSEDLAVQLANHAELVELLMYDGRVEEASQILDALDTPETMALMGTEAVRQAYFNARRRALTILNQGNPPPVTRHDANPADHYRSLRQSVALCVGDFDRAVEVQSKDVQNVRRDLANFKELNYPNGLPKTTGLLDPFDRQLDAYSRARLVQMVLFTHPLMSPHNPVAAHLAGIGQALAFSQHIGKSSQYLRMAEARVNVHLRLALTHLEQGDARSALHHLRQASEAPEFPDPIPAQRLAREYVKAIERATAGRETGP